MRSSVFLAMMMSFSWAISAEKVNAPDLIGLFFDLEGTVIQLNTAEPFENVTAYLLIINPTDPDGVSGWVCSVSESESCRMPCLQLLRSCWQPGPHSS